MASEIWVGLVEVRELPGEDRPITLIGKGAFTWIACWASDEASYRSRVEQVEADYGLFVVDVENAMPFVQAEANGLVGDELADICERVGQDENYCIYGIFHGYSNDQ